MKIKCKQEKFKKAIYNCERAIAKRNTLPILNNILIEADKNGLKLSATNLEIGISTHIGAKIEKIGRITVPARLISGLSGNMADSEEIELEADSEVLKIKNKTNKTAIKGIPADDFPLIPSKKGESLLSFNGLEFKKAINKVIIAAAINEARQELTGVNLKFSQDRFFLAATDSFRLTECGIKLDEKNINKEKYLKFLENIQNVIVPIGTLLEVSRIISDDTEEKIELTIEDGQIFFEIDGVKLVSRLIDGKYPQYEYIMPENYKTRIVGEKKILQNALRTASLFSSGASHEITLKIEEETGKVFIRSSSAETGENSTELKFDVIGPSREVIFNVKYLLDGINVITTNQVALLFNSESTPAGIREINEKTGEVLDDFIYIAMPIKN